MNNKTQMTYSLSVYDFNWHISNNTKPIHYCPVKMDKSVFEIIEL